MYPLSYADMENFVFHNPTKIVFGKGTISGLSTLLPSAGKVMMTFGSGSIRKNGVYDQVTAALKSRGDFIEFGGIEANPEYATLMKAVKIAKKEKVSFLLSVGGGSILDGTKFIAAAIEYTSPEPWHILEKSAEVKSATPIGAVLTLPATGSEMNGNAVISRAETKQKLAFGTAKVLPQFSILDPETTFTLPPRQTANGIVDTMVHVFEQYATKDMKAPLVEAIAEAILKITIENGRLVLASPRDYDIRANLMWASTLALNGLIGLSAANDWTSHMIGHEITAFHGLDHGQTLAVIWPNVARFEMKAKSTMLARYARNVWAISEADDLKAAAAGIDRTVEFWNSVGAKTTLTGYGVGDDRFADIAERLGGGKMGENGDIGRKEVLKILEMSR